MQKHTTIKKAFLGILLFALTFFASSAKAEEKVLVSIAPLHSLVSSVMKNVGTPELLMPKGVSPHSYSLKPSDIQKIENADIVFLTSPYLETFMMKPILKREGKVVYLMDNEELKILPLRDPVTFEETQDNKKDTHIWMNTTNAIQMVQRIAVILADRDWKNANTYIKNANETIQKLKNFSAQQIKLLSTVRQIPFIVYHDGWQYLEKQNKLTNVGIVIIDEEITPSIKHRLYLQETAKINGVKCLFVEPWYNNESTKNLAQDLNLEIVEIDPMGSKFPAGPNQYFNMIKYTNEAIKKCLSTNIVAEQASVPK